MIDTIHVLGRRREPVAASGERCIFELQQRSAGSYQKSSSEPAASTRDCLEPSLPAPRYAGMLPFKPCARSHREAICLHWRAK